MAKVGPRRNNTRGVRRGTKKRTTTKRKRGKKVTRKTCRGKKQKTSARNGRAVRFAKFESSGKNNRFRPTKAEIKPPKMDDLGPSGYGDLLLAPPCCGHMKNYQDSIVGLVRTERTFFLTHEVPSKDFQCEEFLSPSQTVRQDRYAPRVPAFSAPKQGRRQGVQVQVPPPTQRRSHLYDEIDNDRNRLHDIAVRVSEFHRNECEGFDEEDGLTEEPLTSRQFVDPSLVEHCPDCKKDADWCDCPICNNYI